MPTTTIISSANPAAYLQDIPGELVTVGQLPQPPDGAEIRRVDVIIRIRRRFCDTSLPQFRIVLNTVDFGSAHPYHNGSALGGWESEAAGFRSFAPPHTSPRSMEGSMASLKGSKTEENLKAAFAGESQANRRYLYFAQKADVEGYNDVSAVFRSTAEGETGHAHGHLEYLEEVGDPATGSRSAAPPTICKAAIAGETHEYTDMYPGMARTAREEGFDEIADWFETLAKAEKSHAGRFQRALDTLA